ncbi:MAG: hypothetical protein M3076_20065 [Actinomycetota bacterium]|nr:hypothetical protein [Actinomycetota bacterium]
MSAIARLDHAAESAEVTALNVAQAAAGGSTGDSVDLTDELDASYRTPGSTRRHGV